MRRYLGKAFSLTVSWLVYLFNFPGTIQSHVSHLLSNNHDYSKTSNSLTTFNLFAKGTSDCKLFPVLEFYNRGLARPDLMKNNSCNSFVFFSWNFLNRKFLTTWITSISILDNLIYFYFFIFNVSKASFKSEKKVTSFSLVGSPYLYHTSFQ